MMFVARSLQVWPASQLPCLVCLTNCDETHQTFQPGREALAHPGRCPLAAVAVAGCSTLLPSRHAASAGLGCLRPAIAVSSAVAVVAAVRVQLSHRHRLGAAVTPLSHHGGVAEIPGVTEPTLALVPRAKYRHASAAPLAGLINLHPLHSISLQFRRLHFRSIRSDGRKLPRPSKTAVRPKIPEAAMLRISATTGNMAARLRPAKKSAIARDASHGQDIGITALGSACRRGRGNNREIGHFRTASISQAALQRTETAELTGKATMV